MPKLRRLTPAGTLGGMNSGWPLSSQRRSSLARKLDVNTGGFAISSSCSGESPRSEEGAEGNIIFKSFRFGESSEAAKDVAGEGHVESVEAKRGEFWSRLEEDEDAEE
jgi:hypothetical protein